MYVIELPPHEKPSRSKGTTHTAILPLGGLHDDLAHELLGLDDLDEPIQYLLPLGRTSP
ncbi:hypothetical protein ACF073_28535 [Streptomyces sp. NPDC015171]|uniref:hypothetical protein n=1 Tax=Streptomyces sp. NPDC015171 TaxID=3364945 RepID=UPI003700AB62